MANYKEFFAEKTTQVFLTAMLVMGIFIALIVSSHYYFRSNQEEYVKPWRMADSLRGKDFATYIAALNTPTSKTLYVQYQEIDELKNHHLLAATTLYRNYYSVVTTLTVFSVLLAVSIFLLIKSGWDGENTNTLKSLFVSTSVITTVLSGYVQVYDLQKNTAKNLERYFAFEKIQLDLHSACVGYTAPKPTSPSVKKDLQAKPNNMPFKNINLDSLVVAINHAVKENRGLMMDFSVDKIPKMLEQGDKFAN